MTTQAPTPQRKDFSFIFGYKVAGRGVAAAGGGGGGVPFFKKSDGGVYIHPGVLSESSRCIVG